MRLYSSPASPFVRKVRVTIIETEQSEEVEIVPATGTAVDPGTLPLQVNPLGKIPTLERASGTALYDSRVICRYLDDRAKAGLYSDGARHWEILTLEATADGIMDAAVLGVYEKRIRPDDMQYQPWLDAQWGKITRALDAVETRWMSHLSGPINIGQIAMGCGLGYLDFRYPDQNWRKGRDGLANWYETFSQRPSMLETVPQG